MSGEPNYRYSQTVGFYTGTGAGRGFFNPVDVAIGRDGTLYVLSRGSSTIALESRRVGMCTLAEDYLGDFGSGGTEDGQFMWPVAIALDRDENVYVSDEALHRISIFDKKGKFLGKWGVQGNGYGQFEKPNGVVFDQDDNLLVVDSGNNRIQRYAKDGACLDVWGQPGRGDGQFNLPWGITTDQEGNVYTADWRNDRIQKFDAGGNHLATIGTSGRGDGELSRPAGVGVDNQGNIFVADWGNERVQLLGPDGRFIVKFRGEGVMSRWAQEYLEVNPEELEARQMSDMEPDLDSSQPDFLRYQSASVEKLFWGPTSVKIDSEGGVYIVDSLRHRIQIYLQE